MNSPLRGNTPEAPPQSRKNTHHPSNAHQDHNLRHEIRPNSVPVASFFHLFSSITFPRATKRSLYTQTTLSTPSTRLRRHRRRRHQAILSDRVPSAGTRRPEPTRVLSCWPALAAGVVICTIAWSVGACPGSPVGPPYRGCPMGTVSLSDGEMFQRSCQLKRFAK